MLKAEVGPVRLARTIEKRDNAHTKGKVWEGLGSAPFR